jgi:hypothetical protein
MDREAWGIRRRVVTWLIALPALLAAAPSALAANPIQAENANPGDSYWTAALSDPSSSPAIEGYASATSVLPGGSISFHVSTSSANRYRIEISRLGWYGGLGGRRLGCLVGSTLDSGCTSDETGTPQPAAPAPDPGTGEIDAGWSTSDTLTVPADWTTGYYLAVFRITSGPSAGKTGFTPFIVQAAVGDRAAILVQVPSNTWQAYNTWGGRDLYPPNPAIKVSFNRPYSHRMLFQWEYPLIRYLERGGWDVSYATDDDVDADPAILLDHKLDMTAGHDEYWTKAMRDGWEAARAAGVNLAFMGANTGYWQVRYEDGQRTMVGYKTAPDPDPDPTERTTQFRLLATPRPECELEGVQYQNAYLAGKYLDYTADPAVASDPWFFGSGVTPGSILSGLGGYEVDAVTPGCHVPPVTPLLSYTGPPFGSGGTPTQMDAVRYTACSGAEVFSAGSLQFAWGLDPWRDPAYAKASEPPEPPANAGLQQAVSRMLANMTQSHVPVPGPPHVCVPQASFSVSAPWAAVGQTITFTSTATDPYGQISGQNWSFSGVLDDSKLASPAVSRVFQRPGKVKVALQVTDSSGAAATQVETIDVCACPPPGQPSAPRWTPGAQTATACQLVPIGTSAAVYGRYWFEPHASISRYSVTTYQLSAGRSGQITRRRKANANVKAARAIALPYGSRRAPLFVDVTSRVAGRVLRQQLLLVGRRVPPQALAETLCDGTSGRVLTPVFGSKRAVPLRVAVSGSRKMLVTVVGPSGIRVFRHVVRGRTLVILSARHLPFGLYRIIIRPRASWLGQPLVLGAARI